MNFSKAVKLGKFLLECVSKGNIAWEFPKGSIIVFLRKIIGFFQKKLQFFRSRENVAYFVSNTFELIVLLKSSQNIPFVGFFEREMSF